MSPLSFMVHLTNLTGCGVRAATRGRSTRGRASGTAEIEMQAHAKDLIEFNVRLCFYGAVRAVGTSARTLGGRGTGTGTGGRAPGACAACARVRGPRRHGTNGTPPAGRARSGLRSLRVRHSLPSLHTAGARWGARRACARPRVGVQALFLFGLGYFNATATCTHVHVHAHMYMCTHMHHVHDMLDRK